MLCTLAGICINSEKENTVLFEIDSLLHFQFSEQEGYVVFTSFQIKGTSMNLIKLILNPESLLISFILYFPNGDFNFSAVL